MKDLIEALTILMKYGGADAHAPTHCEHDILFRNDPLRAERAIGQMYGHAFKKREELYEATLAGGHEWPVDVTEVRRRDR